MTNSTSGQDKFAEAGFWDRVASQRVYAAFDQEEYEEVFRRSLAADITGLKIVDIGSASGVSAALLAARGADIVGIDISPKLVEQSRQLWQEYADRMTFMVGDAENLDMSDKSVDACFFGGVLHHFPHKERVYKEALRILKPGGHFVALEPNRLDIFERIEWAVADLRNKLAPSEYPIDPIEMKRELMAHGLTDVVFWTMRSDIPVLNQIPLVKRLFSRQKGFGIKRPILQFVDAFRPPEARGTFFVIKATKP